MVKEKELRLALVCFGGVSLAVYMFGITREIQKLLRASKLLHSVRDTATRKNTTYRELNNDVDRETDTESIYFTMLNEIGVTTELRVLTDIIAGASAGGINGIFLAHAIAEDLSLDSLRKLWLENADVEKLLDKEAISNRWSKFYLRPILGIINLFRSDGLDEELGAEVATEVRGKLSRFVRSRWFKPPFSGKIFSEMLYNGMVSIRNSNTKSSSLLPPGYPLDLFVTVTDFFGHAQELKMNSPATVQEREHRLVIGFHESGLSADGKRSLGDIADLAFAARCTASFPGAFPPATLGEMDEMLRDNNQKWHGRTAFVRRAFSQLFANGSNPETSAFIDGSVLNNKPFGEALGVLGSHPAHREVDRRVVYIDPKPNNTAMNESSLRETKIPGFFQSLRASLSDIPRNQPIRDDLEGLEAHAIRSEQLRRVLAGMSDDVDAEISRTIGVALEETTFDSNTLADWRRHAHRASAISAGFTYGPYIELKVSRVLADTSNLLNFIVTRRHGARLNPTIKQAVSDWAKQKKMDDLGKINPSVPASDSTPWVIFLQNYDLSFRIRRMRFIIRRLNQFYATTDNTISHAHIDTAKQSLYKCLSLLTSRKNLQHISSENRSSYAQAILGTNEQKFKCIKEISAHLDLIKIDTIIDNEITAMTQSEQPQSIRDAILKSYLGFSFYDIAVLPMMQSESADELEKIKVDRISPNDCHFIREKNTGAMLRGGRFNSFGAFFSRTYRENDYLWGRLNGVERLIDIVVSSIDSSAVNESTIKRWKNDAFLSVLRTERRFLGKITSLIDQLTQELEATK
jgi:patatin-related protein